MNIVILAPNARKDWGQTLCASKSSAVTVKREPHKMLNLVFRASRAAKLNFLLLSFRTARHTQKNENQNSKDDRDLPAHSRSQLDL